VTVTAIVYAKHDCSVCEKAKLILQRNLVPFKVCYVDTDVDAMVECAHDDIGLDCIPAIRVYNGDVEVARWLADDIMAGLEPRVKAAAELNWSRQEWRLPCPQIEPKE
jgi:hypothetical protein